MTNLFEKLLHEKTVLLADGATGTSFFAMGLQSGDAPELCNSDYPDRVAQHYQSFIDAGSDIVLTNTFGGMRYRLKLHKAQHRVTELNVAAATILRDVTDRYERDIVVAGSIGPTGEILAPLGDLQAEDAVSAFEEQALAAKYWHRWATCSPMTPLPLSPNRHWRCSKAVSMCSGSRPCRRRKKFSMRSKARGKLRCQSCLR